MTGTRELVAVEFFEINVADEAVMMAMRTELIILGGTEGVE